MRNPPASNNPSRTMLPATHSCPTVLKKGHQIKAQQIQQQE